jgi:hypothetical protein
MSFRNHFGQLCALETQPLKTIRGGKFLSGPYLLGLAAGKSGQFLVLRAWAIFR